MTQGAGDRPGGISPPKNPLAKCAQQELPYHQGSWLVEPTPVLLCRHGDCHIGFREGDDKDLARWAAKQRAAWRSGCLAPQRHVFLVCLVSIKPG